MLHLILLVASVLSMLPIKFLFLAICIYDFLLVGILQN